jgi:hypothetical protein
MERSRKSHDRRIVSPIGVDPMTIVALEVARERLGVARRREARRRGRR